MAATAATTSMDSQPLLQPPRYHPPPPPIQCDTDNPEEVHQQNQSAPTIEHSTEHTFPPLPARSILYVTPENVMPIAQAPQP